MKHLFTFTLTLLLSLPLLAQEVDYPGKKQIDKANFPAALKEIQKRLDKSPDDVLALYGAAQYYSRRENDAYAIDKAYQHICKAKDEFMRLEGKEQEKLSKKGLTQQALNEAIQVVCEYALVDAESVGTEVALSQFLSTYLRAVPSQQRRAKNVQSAIAYSRAQERNTVGAYTLFIEQHPDAKETAEAISRRDALAFEAARQKNTLAAYKQFIEQYPESAERFQAEQALYDLAYRDAQRIDTPEAYEHYAVSYPQSTHSAPILLEHAQLLYPDLLKQGNWRQLRTLAERKSTSDLNRMAAYYAMLHIAQQRVSLDAAKYLYENTPIRLVKDSAWLVMRQVYCNGGLMADLKTFYTTYPCEAFPDITQKDQTLLHAFYEGKGYTIDDYIRFAAPERAAYAWLGSRLKDHIEQKRFNLALNMAESFADSFGNDPSYQDLLTTLREAPQQTDIQPAPFDTVINSSHEEYSPVMAADGKTLYFVRTKSPQNIGGEDIFFSTLDNNGIWHEAALVPELNTSSENEAMQSVSADGTRLIFFRSGYLYTTYKTLSGWAKPERLPTTINISEWQSDAMISSDGKALIFTSKRRVENEVNASINIFVSLLDSAGHWQEPIDLGPTINTPFQERKPFLHPDMRTLYFSSAGHGTLGDLDVFKTTRLRDDSWTEWSEPVNLGVAINSIKADWGYKISTDGMQAYFSNGVDLFYLDLPESMRPNAVATIEGNVYTDDGEPVSVTMRWEDLESHEDLGVSRTAPKDGAFYIVLPLGKNYGYYIDDEQFFPVASNIDLRDSTENLHLHQDIYLTSYKQMVEQGQAVQMNNLFFPVNEYELLPQSENELRRIAEIIKSHTWQVEISGHTDSSGDKRKNQVLSQQRAASVRTFLIEQGCDPEQLTAIGYGASRPVADNDTDEGKQQNRRVELRFK